MKNNIKTIISLVLVPILLLTSIAFLIITLLDDDKDYLIPNTWISTEGINEASKAISSYQTGYHNYEIKDNLYLDNQYFSSILLSEILQINSEEKTITYPVNDGLKIEQLLYYDDYKNPVILYNFYNPNNELINTFYFLLKNNFV